MDQKTAKLITEIFKISTYNKETNTLEISIETCQRLNINGNCKKKLKKIFNELGINIEYHNKILPDISKIEYFEEYNQIKQKLETATDRLEIKSLEQKRITIRNIIFESNMKLIRSVINRRLNNSKIKLLISNTDIEDLYQMGYEILLNYLDKHYLDSKKIKKEIQTLLIIYIRRTLYTEIGISTYTGEQLFHLLIILNKNPNISLKDLSKELDIDEKQINNLLTLANIISTIDINSIEQIDSREEYSNPLEDSFIEMKQFEYILKMIDTIPGESQREVIKELYGFNGEKLTYQELAIKMENTSGSIDSKRQKALEHLKFFLRSKYIKEIMNIQLNKDEINIDLSKLSKEDRIKLEKLELFLLKQLNKSELTILTKNIPPHLQESLFVYLGYYEKYYLSTPTNVAYKQSALRYIRNKIQEMYVENSQNENIKNYIDYLMYNYLNKEKKLSLKRK